MPEKYGDEHKGAWKAAAKLALLVIGVSVIFGSVVWLLAQ